MQTPDNCFTRFKQSTEEYSLPEKFTFPFCYEPHPLCELAANELQRHLKTQTSWKHNFGLEGESEGAIGKMFGVLVVQNQAGELGYLSAFSGKLAERNDIPGFVPPVFDMLTEGSFFLKEQAEINQINYDIEKLENNPEINWSEQYLADTKNEAEKALTAHKSAMSERKKARKALRANINNTLTGEEHQQLIQELNQQSVIDKLKLRDLKIEWEQKTAEAQSKLTGLLAPINELKEQRKKRSHKLQKQLFAQYRFLNQSGAEKDLTDIFKDTPSHIPPAGAGECAAPKLLQYAFKHKLKPVAMAEFWWGISPKSEVRRHKYYYGSCKGKCEPILGHMLEGIEMDDNPLAVNLAEGKELEIIYQDDSIVVVNKPAELLSVPGKSVQDSAYLRVKQMFPEATGSLTIHRLDMSTSGLLVFALSHRAQKHLHKQFISRTVQKRYVALIDGVPENDSGEINLPMRGDQHDRPRQLICYEHGKPAQTRWEVCERRDGKTKVYLYPKTGRTHQLRVHCAHVDGLNMPIVGDDLYGQKANRLHLHAESLTLEHPITKEIMHFQADAEF
ncbi:pseudouridine synthase [Vibrio sp. JC009]|uniref:RluA family pseudouridine synthase n=1 Tax=Vibrio sp. JC009 TaxID=2912314 RepID=UPI0023B01BE3|nr:RluA family pseudouridine synthase [Vibrio sp. JC009]WED22894.1 pseudouridine synthase [Vibrio sp. JC009]